MLEINFKNKKMKIPIIQGGMGVGISLGNLAGNVAYEGGMGVISGVNPGFKDVDFLKHPLKSNVNAIKTEIEKARNISKGNGLIGINVMVAINDFASTIKAACENGVDAVICGAGLPLNLPSLVNDDTLIAPIVSSVKALNLIVKTWEKKYNRYPDFVVVEGPLAGGHLGFKKDEIESASLNEIIKDVSIYIKNLEERISKRIYLFAAGGIRTSQERKILKDLGADGIQVATPFIATEECDADENFKLKIVNSNDSDLRIIKSPVGLMARAIENEFLASIDYDNVQKRFCTNCLKTCDPKKTPYCIAKYLSKSAQGFNGVVFSGANINSINKISSVKEVINKLLNG